MSIWTAVIIVGGLGLICGGILAVMWAVQEWGSRDRRAVTAANWIGEFDNGSRLAAGQDAEMLATLDQAYGQGVSSELAVVDQVIPTTDVTQRIRARLGALRFMNVLATIAAPRRDAATPFNVRRPLELRPGDVIVARPPNPEHPERDGEPGRWTVTAVERCWDRVAVDATDPADAAWRFVLDLTAPIRIDPTLRKAMR